jgi:hypothetical protein
MNKCMRKLSIEKMLETGEGLNVKVLVQSLKTTRQEMYSSLSSSVCPSVFFLLFFSTFVCLISPLCVCTSDDDLSKKAT